MENIAMASSEPTTHFSSTLKPSYVPKTVENLLEDLKAVSDPSNKLSVLSDYILQHEDELKYVQPFKSVLPQCTLFLRDSIKTLKFEYLKVTDSMEAYRPEQPAATDPTGTTGPTGLTLMEALGIKRREPEPDKQNEVREVVENSRRNGKEPAACSSADHQQFWNPNDDSCKKQKTFVEPYSGGIEEEPFFIPSSGDGSTQFRSFQVFGADLQPSDPTITDLNIGIGFTPDREGGSFYPEIFQQMAPNTNQNISQQPPNVARSNEVFAPYNNDNTGAAPAYFVEGRRAPVSGPAGNNNGLNLRANSNTLNYHPRPLNQPIWKNNRLSWTAELHQRFLEALEMVGGIGVATPKQIRNAMQVEGLTTDQVKSHLQKYRLQYTDPPAENYRVRRRASWNFEN